MDNNTTKLLLDLVQTARDDNFNLDVTLARFPELQGVDKKLLGDFVATARDTEYDMEKTFSLFPEITGETKEQTGEPGKQVTPTIFRGTPLAGEDPSTSSGEQGVEDTILQEEEAKKKEEEAKTT